MLRNDAKHSLEFRETVQAKINNWMFLHVLGERLNFLMKQEQAPASKCTFLAEFPTLTGSLSSSSTGNNLELWNKQLQKLWEDHLQRKQHSLKSDKDHDIS